MPVRSSRAAQETVNSIGDGEVATVTGMSIVRPDDQPDEVSSFDSSCWGASTIAGGDEPTRSLLKGTAAGEEVAVADGGDGNEQTASPTADGAEEDDEVRVASLGTPEGKRSKGTASSTQSPSSGEECRDSAEPPAGGCCWLRRVPCWVRLLLAASTVLFLGAVAVVAVSFTMDLRGGDGSPTDQTDASTQEGVNNANDQPALAPVAEPAAAPVAIPATEAPRAPVPAPVPVPAAPGEEEGPVAETGAPVMRTGAPAGSPSSAPTEGQQPDVMTFYVTAGLYQNDNLDQALTGLRLLPNDGTSFLVHLGDWNSPAPWSGCDEAVFEEADGLFQNSAIPVYMIMGDNEYNDCPNPSEARALWKDYFVGYETEHWEEQPWEVWRQGDGDKAFEEWNENFAFRHKRVAFVGINLVGGTPHDQGEFQLRNAANLLWFEETCGFFRDTADIMFLFAHDTIPGIAENEGFYDDLLELIEKTYTNMHFFIVNRSEDARDYGMEREYDKKIPNLSVISVLGSLWPPLQITLDLSLPAAQSVTIDEEQWYDELVVNQLPVGP